MPVTTTVYEPLDGNRNWEIVQIDQNWTKKDFQTLELNLDVPANGENVVHYTVRYEY